MRTVACGRAKRLPFSPSAKMIEAMEAAIPVAMVETGDLMKFMVSTIAMPEVITPPGELMYM